MNRYGFGFFSPLAALLCASCASMEETEFYVEAINTDTEKVSCIILRDDELVLDNATNDYVKTPATVWVRFHEDRDGDGKYDGVKLGVRPVVIDAQGKIIQGTKEADPTPYLEDSRHVYSNDAKTQLFILRRNKNSAE
jgi:hypothetical protein